MTTHTVTFCRIRRCLRFQRPFQLKTIAIDFGASSLIALNQAGIPHRDIDAVILTHMSLQMLAQADNGSEGTAYDGMAVTV